MPTFSTGWSVQLGYYGAGLVCLKNVSSEIQPVGSMKGGKNFPYELIRDYAGNSANGFKTQFRLARSLLNGGLASCQHLTTNYNILLYVVDQNTQSTVSVFPVQDKSVFSIYHTVNITMNYACNYSCSIPNGSANSSSVTNTSSSPKSLPPEAIIIITSSSILLIVIIVIFIYIYRRVKRVTDVEQEFDELKFIKSDSDNSDDSAENEEDKKHSDKEPIIDTFNLKDDLN